MNTNTTGFGWFKKNLCIIVLWMKVTSALGGVMMMPGGGGGGGGEGVGGALRYLVGCIRARSLSKFKNTPKVLIAGQKSTLIFEKTLTFPS